MEPVKIPIEDIIDLHTFRPKDVPYLLEDYFSACIDKGIFSVRVIHGKGKGILKKRVQEIVSKNPMVESFRDALPGNGGWGASIVELKKR
jgi:DNA-nicking Smr family endonuclease